MKMNTCLLGMLVNASEKIVPVVFTYRAVSKICKALTTICGVEGSVHKKDTGKTYEASYTTKKEE